MPTDNIKSMERLIDEMEELGFLEAIGDGISIQDTNFKILYQNKRAKEIIGNHVGKYCYEAYESRHEVCEECPLARSFKDGGTHTVERKNLSRERPLTVEITTSPLRDKAGHIIGGIEVARNITARKQTERALEDSEKQYRSIVDSSLVGIYRTNLKGEILYVNDALAHMFDFLSPEEMMSVGVLSLYKNPEDRDLLIETLNRAGKVQAFEIEAVTKAGTTKNILFNATLQDNTISGMIMDITERKKIEEELQARVQELEKFYEIAITREIKMKELKEEVDTLKSELKEKKL
jgi:PAS domain S-box-containing protein